MNRLFLSLAAGITIISGLLIFQATRSGASMVLTVSELLNKAEAGSMKRVRIGARVGNEDITYDLRPKALLRFTAHDPNDAAKSVPVKFEGAKPNLLENGRDVLIDGDYIEGVLVAHKLLTKCPSKYEPPPGALK